MNEFSPRTDRPPPAAPDEPTDEELDRYVDVRLRLAGIDLSVLPEDDPSAPADRTRILRSARSFLRGTVTALAARELDPQEFPPVVYPAALPRVGAEGGEEGA
jgi:hypothetical protein